MRIRVLQGVSGTEFSWAPGSEIELPEEEAVKWADGVRAELIKDERTQLPTEPVDQAEQAADKEDDVPQDDEVTRAADDEASAAAQPADADSKPEKAARRSRGGGRAAKPETRG
ncbi:hypothetical protein [Amycolatopsis methanolica]|uniref:hypothetical protein n=1 Tax=Amycolatopsis methanolica TaxID=1814 RepID=UPI0012E0087D|nr:hypothetical protein [Amycolatopsis methanolica]